MSRGIIRKKSSALLRSRDGSAAAEVALSLSAILAIAVAASDLGVLLRGDAALEAGVRDAARVLSLVPLNDDGAPLPEGRDLAEAVLRARLAEAGLTPQEMTPPPPGAVCADDGAVCVRVDPAAGSLAALGSQRSVVTVWAAASARTQFVDVFFPGAGGGAVVLGADLGQMVFR